MGHATDKVDAIQNQPYSEDLYRYASVYDQAVSNLQAISDDDWARYQDQGFFVVENPFPESMIANARRAISDLVAKGVPDDGRSELMFESSAAGRVAELSGTEREDAVRKLMNFIHLDPRLMGMVDFPPLRNTLARILGEEAGLFQDMALLKPPRMGREKPWHQDQAYFNVPQGVPVVGLWIALDDATPENGCMHFIPGGHRQGPIGHFQRRDWQLCDTEILGREIVAVPVKRGGMIVFDSLTPHGTPENRSGERRWALQFHFRPATVPMLPDSSERQRVFGAEAAGQTC